MELSVHALSGGLASVGAMALLYPLENIRCRLQVQSSRSESRNQVLDQEPNDRLKGVLHAFRAIPQREGFCSMFKGINSALTGVFVGSATYFFFYELLKKQLALPSQEAMPPSKNLAIAAMAGIANVFATNPIWVIQTRSAVGKNTMNSSLLHCLYATWRKEGMSGIYAGLVPSLVLVCNPAIQFAAYDQMVSLMSHRRHKRLSNSQYFIVGALAKAIATVLTYPLQLVKSRLQVFVTPESGPAPESRYKHMLDELRNIYLEEGFAALYSGFWAKLWQTVLNSAFLFVFYERIFRWISSTRSKCKQRH